MFLNFVVTAVSTLGVGKIPKAPGTWGSLVAVLIWWAIQPLSVGTQVTLIVTAFFIGWLTTHYYEKWNNRHDPKEVVIDELVGMWLTLFMTTPSGLQFILGFLFFRLFDIWKPFPIGWIDKKVPGAFGTMFDDVVAGVFALILVNLCVWMSAEYCVGPFWEPHACNN